jgi:hypothetical protein
VSQGPEFVTLMGQYTDEQQRRKSSMRLLEKMCFVVLASGLALGQATASNSGSAGTGSVADELKALREAIGEQQKQISQQQQQMSQQQQQIQDLRQQLQNQNSGTPHVADAALRTAPVPVAATVVQETEKPKESPLSFRIGGTEFTPGGFVDFNNIFRTTNTGSAVSTGFNAIPFSNTPQGQLTEFRSSGQYSRFNLKVTGKFGENKINGYIESDFNGNDAANVFVTTNPHTLRLRLYYLQLGRGIWDFTVGQAWGLMTPNKVGVGPSPADLDTTLATDGNIMTGVMYSRDAQFRIAVKPNDRFSWALAIENPQQLAPGSVVLPAAYSSALGPQVDGAVTAGVPNLFPDVVTKFAFDTNPSGRNLHFEAGGLITSAKIAVPAPGAPSTGPFVKNSVIGAGGFGGVGLSVTKKFRVLAHGMYGDGVGRYFIGFGPQFVVVPIAVTATTFTAEPSMVHSGSGYGGAEFQLTPKTQIGAYYGGIYYGRNFFPDVTATTPLKPIIGYGGPTSGSTNNRAIQQGEFVLAQTLWKSPQFGALVLASDSSYVTRAPWAHPAIAPKNAHMFMTKIDLKYVLP